MMVHVIAHLKLWKKQTFKNLAIGKDIESLTKNDKNINKYHSFFYIYIFYWSKLIECYLIFKKMSVRRT